MNTFTHGTETIGRAKSITYNASYSRVDMLVGECTISFLTGVWWNIEKAPLLTEDVGLQITSLKGVNYTVFRGAHGFYFHNRTYAPKETPYDIVYIRDTIVRDSLHHLDGYYPDLVRSAPTRYKDILDRYQEKRNRLEK